MFWVILQVFDILTKKTTPLHEFYISFTSTIISQMYPRYFTMPLRKYSSPEEEAKTSFGVLGKSKHSYDFGNNQNKKNCVRINFITFIIRQNI